MWRKKGKKYKRRGFRKVTAAARVFRDKKGKEGGAGFSKPRSGFGFHFYMKLVYFTPLHAKIRVPARYCIEWGREINQKTLDCREEVWKFPAGWMLKVFMIALCVYKRASRATWKIASNTAWSWWVVVGGLTTRICSVFQWSRERI